MIYSLNETHDPAARSWVDSANVRGCEFPIQNLPYGVFSRGKPMPCVGVAIGDQVLDLSGAICDGMPAAIETLTCDVLQDASLKTLMGLGVERWRALRSSIFRALREDYPARGEVAKHLLPMSEVQMLLPARIGDYTDFYASIYHAMNVGSMFRPENPLLPNYKWMPIAYHGRASSIVVSGTPVTRPSGQIKADGADAPAYGPTRRLDYELEAGILIGGGNELGSPVPIDEAEQHAFGMCLVNDWSARDVQTWEYQPLGPFLAKSFATTISPWIVTMEALAPFRVPAFARGNGEPKPLSYLLSEEDQRCGGIDLTLEVYLSTQRMREQGTAPHRLSRGNFKDMYWTISQMIAHHTSNGCNLQPGDLIASGTVSGPTPDSRGCMLELSWRGTQPIELPTGEKRGFLEDGDEVIMKGYRERNGVRIGFGECRGRVEGDICATR
jgi:fumarylacetoacetase